MQDSCTMEEPEAKVSPSPPRNKQVCFFFQSQEPCVLGFREVLNIAEPAFF